MNDSNTIIDFNSNAIFFLNQEKHDLAIALLRKALLKMKQLINHGGSASKPAPCTMSPVKCIPLMATSTCMENIGVTSIQFFNRPFTMPPMFDEFSSPQQDRLTAVTSYNLAFVYHHRGGRSGRSNDLFSALKYYKLALDTILYSGKDIQRDGITLLLLALCNNMGNIHSYFFNIAETKTCCDWVQNLVECIDSIELEEEDIAFFSMYLLASPQWQVLIAPAA